MGFRNPVTSADVLDTRDTLADPGVIIDGTRASWVYGAKSATIELQTAGGVSGGSSFVIKHGAGAGVEFSEVELSAGGYENRARLLGVDRLEPILGPTPLLLPDARFVAYPESGVGWAQPVAWQGADGMVHARGMLQTTGAGNWGGSTVFCRIPAGFPQPGKRLPVTLIAFNNRPARFDLRADGALTWEAPMTADTAYAVGNFVSVTFDYLPD